MKYLVKNSEKNFKIGEHLTNNEAYNLLQYEENVKTLELEIMVEDNDENEYKVKGGFGEDTGVYIDDVTFPGQNVKEYESLFDIVEDAIDIVIINIEYSI